MVIRIAVLLLTVAFGFMTAGATAFGEVLNADILPKGNTGVVLLFTSLHKLGCIGLRVWIAHPDASNNYISDSEILISNSFDKTSEPRAITLPAGHYGFGTFTCRRGIKTLVFGAHVKGRRNIFTGTGEILDPIATFTVKPHEVVDIGYLLIAKGRPGKPTLFGRQQTFNVAVRPMPPECLSEFAKHRPNLYKARVVRLMSTPKPQ
jgi:hypothetical protein